MAIAITTQPAANALNIAYRPIKFLVNTTTANHVNLIADVYFDGAYYVTVTIPVNGAGDATFYFQQLASVYLAAKMKAARYNLPDLALASNTITDCTALIASMKVRFFDETGDGTGLLTSTWAANGAGAGYTESNTSYVLPVTLQHQETQNLNAYSAANNALFLTGKADNGKTRLTASDYLYLIFTNTASHDLIIKTYDATSTLITTKTINFSPAVNYKVLCFGVGPANINAYVAGTIDAAVSYYTVQVVIHAGGNRSVLRTFSMDGICYNKERDVYFMNPYAGWDYLHLKAGESDTLKTGKQGYVKALPVPFSQYDSQSVNLSTGSEKTISSPIYSLDKATAQWIIDLLDAPQVYTVESAQYIPIIVNDTTTQIEDTDGGLVNINLQWKYGFERIRQRQ